MEWRQFYGYYEDAVWRRTAGGKRRLREAYEEVQRAVAADAKVDEWLRWYASMQPLGSDTPDELLKVQAELNRLDRQLACGVAVSRLVDAWESGRQRAGGGDGQGSSYWQSGQTTWTGSVSATRGRTSGRCSRTWAERSWGRLIAVEEERLQGVTYVKFDEGLKHEELFHFKNEMEHTVYYRQEVRNSGAIRRNSVATLAQLF